MQKPVALPLLHQLRIIQPNKQMQNVLGKEELQFECLEKICLFQVSGTWCPQFSRIVEILLVQPC